MSYCIEINPQVSNEELNRLFAESWNRHTETDFAILLDRSFFYACAFLEKELVGFAKVVSDSGSHGFLLDPTVHPNHRNKGLGSNLVKACVEASREGGIEWIHVDYEPHLEAFYASCGFCPTKAAIMNLKETKPNKAVDTTAARAKR